MGREIRRVPPNWQHPKTEQANHRLGRIEERYQPMRAGDVETAWLDWLDEFAKWNNGERERVDKEYGGYPEGEPYRTFCQWYGEPPDPKYYAPKWKEEPTWFQVYETVSEGTPVTPPFATLQEVEDYLVANGDFWDQSREKEGHLLPGQDKAQWPRESAHAFCGRGWAPSLIIKRTATESTIIAPRDTKDSI